MKPRLATSALLLADLVRIAPLAAATALHVANLNRSVEQVVLAETFDRLRRCQPHSLVVLHAEAATGGWSLAAALHLAWERNLAAVIVTRTVAGPSSAALARRLNMSLLVIDGDPLDVALQLAGQVSAPEAARALRQALCAEKLAEQTSVRGVLAVLNTELPATPIALVAGEAVLAGLAGALHPRPDAAQVSVPLNPQRGQPWARLLAAVPRGAPVAPAQVEALLRLARPSLLAAWAQTRLDTTAHADQEAAAFKLLRNLTGDASKPAAADCADAEPPPWSSELGWQLDTANRAIWMAPLQSAGAPPAELTQLIRLAWQRGRPTWPHIAEGEGWLSWHSGSDTAEPAPVRRALISFHDSAVSYQLVLGVGRAHRGVEGLLRSVDEARLAAHMARQDGAGGVRWFDHVGAAAALAWLPLTQISHVAELCLAELMATPDRVALVNTVLAVLDCGGSLVEAAHRLGVHRNTVLARSVRARQLGLPFDDPEQRLAVHVLCYAVATMSQATSAKP